MSESSMTLLLRATAVVGAVLAAAGSVVIIGLGEVSAWWSGGGPLTLLLAIFFSVFVWLMAPQQPRNAVVWTMAVCGLSGGIYAAGYAGAALLMDDPSLVLGDTFVPADAPLTAAWLVVIANPFVYVGLFGWFTFGLLLFPDGRLPSARWRWVGWFAAFGIAVAVAGGAWENRPWSTAPATEDGLLLNIGALVVILAAVVSLASLVGRYRRSEGATRQQFKWVVWGASMVVPVLLAGFILGGGPYEYLILGPIYVAAALMIVSYGIAVARYRLYDIDVVISRTVVYGTLAVVITGVYVALVVGIGQLFGSGSEPNLALAIAVTAVVAVAFQPARRRVQRAANRIVYGKKATPYEVLSEFSHRVAAADDSLLDRVARSLVEGTGAERVIVWVADGDELVKTAGWPDDGDVPVDGGTSFPIDQDGVRLGRLSLAAPAGQRLSADDLRLAGEVASGMGLALRNRLLTRTLQARIAELRVSRRRLVVVQDETRRKLERDLHDGAQQQLVALKVKLGLAQAIAEKDDGAETASLLRQVMQEADVAVDVLRDFARGVYPPLLEAEGLGTAISAQARRSPVPVQVDSNGIGRYDEQVEATVYFCVVEALQNIAKYAAASEAHVRLAQADRLLTFEVTDDGRGFDAEQSLGGTGLANMEDRVDAASGLLTVNSVPGRGTTVRGSVPVGVRT